MTRPHIEDILSALEVDIDAGAFTWKERPGIGVWNKKHAGKAAGYVRYDGYRIIGLHGHYILAHHLVWFLHTKTWPNEIDHIDGNRLNNRLANLREVSRRENRRNAGRNKNNKSGVTGVHWDKNRQKWVAYIWVDRKFKWLGGYNSKVDAVPRRKTAEVALGFHANHGREAPLS